MKKETYEILWKDGIKAKSEQIVNDKTWFFDILRLNFDK